MSKKSLKRNIEMSIPLKCIIGLALSSFIGLLSTLFVSFVFSYFLSNSETITDYVFVYLIFSVIIGSFICGFVGSSFLPFKGIVSGLMSSVTYTIIVFLIVFIFTKGSLNSYSFLLPVFIIISSVVGGITKANLKRRK